LAGIADQQQLDPGVARLPGKVGQGESVGHSGLVHDEQLARLEPPPVELRPGMGQRAS
jgi:hypothetical protein